MSTTVAITLGHDGLTTTISQARDGIRSVIRMADATTLAEALGGLGYWTTHTADGPQHTEETCDIWVILCPNEEIGYLSSRLELLAYQTGQEAIGLLIHDHATFPQSYVNADNPKEILS